MVWWVAVIEVVCFPVRGDLGLFDFTDTSLPQPTITKVTLKCDKTSKKDTESVR